MVNFTKRKFIKSYLGTKNIRSHIDAIHASPPEADEFTGKIVEGVVNKINCSGIIAIVSRMRADLNRPRNNNNKEAIDEYRQTIREILENTNTLSENERVSRPYLHLAIHGMQDGDAEFEIGTRYDKTCSQEVKKWFVNEIEKHIKEVQTDVRFPGDPSKSVHRCGDKTSDLNYLGYGNNFNTFQIEINRTLRKNHQKELINIFSNIILNFNKKFIRNCRNHEKRWNDMCVDKNIKDDWLSRLNGLKSLNLVSICEGISERRGKLIYTRPHVNFKIKPEHFRTMVKEFDKSIISEILQSIFSSMDTEFDFELTRSFRRAMNFNYREGIALKVNFTRQRTSEDIDEETINWFGKVIKKIEVFDGYITNMK